MIQPSFNVKEDVSKDIKRLLYISLSHYKSNITKKWEEVLPIYPTSPISKKQ